MRNNLSPGSSIKILWAETSSTAVQTFWSKFWALSFLNVGNKLTSNAHSRALRLPVYYMYCLFCMCGTETAVACRNTPVRSRQRVLLPSGVARTFDTCVCFFCPTNTGVHSYARRQADARSGILRRRSYGSRGRQPRAVNFIKDAVASLHVSARSRPVPSGKASCRMGTVATIHPINPV